MTNTIGVKIVNELTKDAMEPMAKAIIAIMESRADQKTIRAGLKAFGRVAEVKGITLSGCNVTMDRQGKADVPAWLPDAIKGDIK